MISDTHGQFVVVGRLEMIVKIFIAGFPVKLNSKQFLSSWSCETALVKVWHKKKDLFEDEVGALWLCEG